MPHSNDDSDQSDVEEVTVTRAPRRVGSAAGPKRARRASVSSSSSSEDDSSDESEDDNVGAAGVGGAPAAAAQAAGKKESAPRAKSVGRDTIKALTDALPEPDSKAAGKNGKHANKKYKLHGLNFYGLASASQHASICSLCPKSLRAAAKKYAEEAAVNQAELRQKKDHQMTLDKHVQKLPKLDDADLHEAVAELIVELRLPLTIVESSSFRKMLELAMLRGQTRGPSYHFLSRRELGRVMYDGEDAVLRRLGERDTAIIKKAVVLSYVTAATDGRKGVRGEANEAFFLLSGDVACLSSTTDFALERKTADNYVDYFWEEMQRVGGRFGLDVYDVFFALVTDRGGACRVGRERLEETRAILSVSCKAHEGSLGAKKITGSTDYLSDNVAELVNVVHLFSYSQSAARLREARVALSRVVETRFLYLVQIAIQVRKGHGIINGICQAFGPNSLIDWIQGQDADHKERFAKAKAWLSKAETLVFLDFYIEVMGPLALITREMDRSCNNLYILHPLWGRVSETLGVIFGKPTYQSVPLSAKQAIASAVMDFWSAYSEPADTAAYMMTPQFWNEISRCKQQDPEQYDDLKSDLEKCVRVFLRTRELGSKVRPTVLGYDDAIVSDDWLTFLDEYESAIGQRDKFNPDERGSLGSALRARLAHSPDKPPHLLYLDELPAHKTSLHGPGVALTSIVPTASAVERGHKDERDTRTPARSSTTREHADLLIRARQSLKRRGGLRTIEQVVGMHTDEVHAVPASTSRPTHSPFEVVRKFSTMSAIQETWLASYLAMCEEEVRAVQRGLARAQREDRGADELLGNSDANESADAEDMRVQAEHIIEEAVHGAVEEPNADTRPRRRAAQALRAYVRAAAASGRL